MPLSGRYAGTGPFLEAILDSFQDGLIVLDKNLRILHANQVMTDWHGGESVLGETCFSAYHGRTEPCVECPALRASASGKTEKGEVTFVREDGTSGRRELTVHPVFDKAGALTGVVGTAREVSARREAEALRREQQDLYRSLFESNTSVILLIDPETAAIRDANPRACSFYGFSRDLLRTMTITEINVLSGREVLGEMERAKAERRTSFHFSHRLADGSVREVEVFSGPMTVAGRPLLCWVVHDITERKAADRERERLITDLRKALSEVKTLQGLIPICSSCHRIRDDEGLWNRIEVYIRDHSHAELTHGLCPDCIDRLYPDLKEEE